MLKKLCPVILAGLVLLPGCGIFTTAQPPVPPVSPSPTAASPSPSPSPSKTPLNVSLVAAETDLIRNRVRNLLSKPLYGSYNETEPVFAVVIVYTGSNSRYYSLTTHDLVDAEIHLSNVYSLASEKRLSNETAPRTVEASEYINEINEAMASLSLQKDETLEAKSRAIAWIRGFNSLPAEEKPHMGTISPEYKVSLITDATNFCDSLTAEIDVLNARLQELTAKIEQSY